MSKRGRDGLKQLMGSLGNSSCNDLPQNGHLGLHALQTDDDRNRKKNRKEIVEDSNKDEKERYI